MILIFSFLTFLYFKSDSEKKLTDNEKKVQLVEKENIELIEEKIESSNIIEDVSYSAKDTKGNEYFLQARKGTIDQNDSNFIFLTSVKANIDLKNYKSIKISSDFGKYNTVTYDTIFSKNVEVDYIDNKLTGNYLDFSMKNNLLIISKNVVYTNPNNILKADVIKLDTITKDTKIFMYNSDEKVKVKSKN